ncbi:MAG: hypothetical protein H8Z69_01915 [Nanohaloarchaea archaeon]|nr:hypothetical protein [Candidatus Nanohaloarchaea archaeon]
MGWGDKVLVKPGTILLAVFMISLGLIMFNWASGFLQKSDRKTSQESKDLQKCSGLDVEIVDVDIEGDNVSAFFKVNKEMDTIYVNFEGDRNVTKKVADSAPGSLRTVKARVSNLSELYLKAEGCAKVFRR